VRVELDDREQLAVGRDAAHLEHGDRRLPWRRRSVCCLAYQTPRWATQYCSNCPLIPPDETVRRINEWLRDQDDA
jgi:ferric iron reductase protein FhuF